MIRVFLIILCFSFSHWTFAHGRVYNAVPSDSRAIEFPDTKDHKTMVVDLHTHSVFSDGHVWPSVRVAEAQFDGLDAVAITEHLEYQPHQKQIPHEDRNTPYQEAFDAALGSDLFVINGVEITRKDPMGHMNAIFVTDANPLVRVPESYNDVTRADLAQLAEEAVNAANEQGAFVFWNHAWASSDLPSGRPRMTDFHGALVKRNELHGIEIANGKTYNEEAHAIALKHDLVLIGTSDVHDLIDWDYEPHKGGHRPVTLVLTEERSLASLKEALFAGRTAVWIQNTLIAREAQMQQLLEACLTVDEVVMVTGREMVAVTLTNHSDVDFRLRHTSTKLQSFSTQADLIDVPPHESLQIYLKPKKLKGAIKLEFEVLNALIAPNKHPSIKLEREVSSAPQD